MVQHLPVVTFEPGELLIQDGHRTGSMWVLVSGSVEIVKDGVRISVLSRPGTSFGDIAAILGSSHTASVRVVERSSFHYAQDGRTLLLGDPELLLLVAGGLAERLDVVTRYLADLKTQYGHAPGLDMVSEVLGQLARPSNGPMRPGSIRDPG